MIGNLPMSDPAILVYAPWSVAAQNYPTFPSGITPAPQHKGATMVS